MFKVLINSLKKGVTMKYEYKKITVITGYYGCGKTNLAVNLAEDMAKLGSVTVADMDIVNPYFRTADFKERLENKGIKVVCTEYANTNLDIPVLNFDMESLINGCDHLIIDVGGDDAGAYALGRYKKIFEKYKDQCEVMYVYSMYRNVNEDISDTVNTMKEIEKASGLKCTVLVNNSNLGCETDSKVFERSMDYSREMEKESGLKHAFHCIPKGMKTDDIENFFPVERMVKAVWEE